MVKLVQMTVAQSSHCKVLNLAKKKQKKNNFISTINFLLCGPRVSSHSLTA